MPNTNRSGGEANHDADQPEARKADVGGGLGARVAGGTRQLGRRLAAKPDVAFIATLLVAVLGGAYMLLWNRTSEVAAEVQALRTEMDWKIEALRNDVREDLTALRIEMREDMAALRSEVREDIAEVRGEVATLREDMNAGFRELRDLILTIQAPSTSDGMPPGGEAPVR